ncbi:Putative malate dehydrogenase 1B [Dufourea novaeangliae]|uniref:Putative malate dehydrogenase 1B n=1 Tax=Dufourea novaeangliae TaxID=178035 RepID=A0A154PED3_DUFNO|nr:Putative malate dehydrogenase 1B [Dufourea novaeangliae]
MIIGAGRSMCPDLVPQLIMTKELWLSHGVVINLYDEPGRFFKLRKILKDVNGLGGVLFCSMGPICFHVEIMHRLVTKLPKTSIVAVSSHYGLEMTCVFAQSSGFTLKNFGCPPVWGYLGINQFVDIHHMIQKCDYYLPNRRALESSETTTLPIGVQRSELRWFFYISHNKTDPYRQLSIQKSLVQYQVGRSEDFQKCRAICDLLKLWYRKEVGDEIISLGIFSDGSFGIPEGLVFSQPVYLKVLEDHTRIWVPFTDFPMPNMPISFFQNLLDIAIFVKEKIPVLEEGGGVRGPEFKK